MTRFVRGGLLTAAFASLVLLVVVQVAPAEEVLVDRTQKAGVVLKNGQRHSGILYMLTSEKVKLRITAAAGTPDRTVVWDASEVREVHLAGGIYAYDEGKRTFVEKRASTTKSSTTKAKATAAAKAEKEGEAGKLYREERQAREAERKANEAKAKAQAELVLRNEEGMRIATKQLEQEKINAVARTAANEAALKAIQQAAPLRIGEFRLGSQTSYQTEKWRMPTRLVQQREGFVGTGKFTGTTFVEGGEEYESTTAKLHNSADAEAVVENPFDRPVTLKMRLVFRFESGSGDWFHEYFRDVDSEVTIPPRTVTTVGASCNAVISDFRGNGEARAVTFSKFEILTK